MKIKLDKSCNDVILVVKKEKTDFVNEEILKYLTGEGIGAGRAIETGYIINTDAIIHGAPEADLYNKFMITASHHGYKSVFFNN